MSARVQSVYFLNGYFGKMMIESRERNEPLILRVYDVLFDILSFDVSTSSTELPSFVGTSSRKAKNGSPDVYNYSPFPYRWKEDDTMHARLLTGQLALSSEAVGKVPFSAFSHLGSTFIFVIGQHIAASLPLLASSAEIHLPHSTLDPTLASPSLRGEPTSALFIPANRNI